MAPASIVLPKTTVPVRILNGLSMQPVPSVLTLDQGLSKDIALQRAKQDWLNTAEGTNQLPNNWAGLIVVGDTEPLIHLTYSRWIASFL